MATIWELASPQVQTPEIPLNFKAPEQTPVEETPQEVQAQETVQETPQDPHEALEQEVKAQEQTEEINNQIETQIEEQKKLIEENNKLTPEQMNEKIIDLMQSSFSAHIKDINLQYNQLKKEYEVLESSYDELLKENSQNKIKLRRYEWIDIDDDTVEFATLKKEKWEKYNSKILDLYSETAGISKQELSQQINEYRAKMIAQQNQSAITEAKEQEVSKPKLFTQTIKPKQLTARIIRK